jgi:hypothetical protein
MSITRKYKKAFKMTLAMFAAISIFMLSCCIYFRVSSINDVIAYYCMSNEFPDVWKDLALGKVHAGQTLQEIEALNPPLEIRTYGKYSTLSYTTGFSFNGIGITLKDGIACSAGAGSCTWSYEFFNTLTQSDISELRREQEESVSEKAEQGAAKDADKRRH